jgi:hypothetical protein
MWEYQNGNYVVQIKDDGTKLRLSENPIPELPESMDVKITNRCNAGCPFCHEKSTPDGKSFDVNLAYKLFNELPSGIELAIGGGNPLEVKQDLKWLMRKSWGKIFNLTINAIHLKDFTESGIYPEAIGISYRSDLHEEIKLFIEEHKTLQVVIHLIVGVHSVEDFERCRKDFDRVLVMGYKKFGRGINFYNEEVEKEILKWKQKIGYCFNSKILAFDNLALEQLDIEKYFTKDKWKEMYMGKDGEFSMYLDLVEKKYAISSRSEERFDIGDLTIKEMFANLKTI